MPMTTTAAPVWSPFSMTCTNVFPPGAAWDSVGLHVRIAPVGGGHERLLDRPRRHPPRQVGHRARLVVGAAGPRAAEGLLPDHGPGRLVVDVEVPRRVAQARHALVDRTAV